MLLELHEGNRVQLTQNILDAVDKMGLTLLETVLQDLLHQQLPILSLYLLRKRLESAFQRFLSPYLLLCQFHIDLHRHDPTLLEISSAMSNSSSSPKYLVAVYTKFSLPPMILPSKV